MEEDDGRVRRFGFRVTTQAMVTVEGIRASDARAALGGLLEGATARLVSGEGAGLELVDLTVSTDVVLLLVDGVDPLASLSRALSEWRARGDADG